MYGKAAKAGTITDDSFFNVIKKYKLGRLPKGVPDLGTLRNYNISQQDLLDKAEEIIGNTLRYHDDDMEHVAKISDIYKNIKKVSTELQERREDQSSILTIDDVKKWYQEANARHIAANPTSNSSFFDNRIDFIDKHYDILSKKFGYKEVRTKRKGAMYMVDIPEKEDLLIWKEPLSKQPTKVQEALRSKLKDANLPDKEGVFFDGEELESKFKKGWYDPLPMIKNRLDSHPLNLDEMAKKTGRYDWEKVLDHVYSRVKRDMDQEKGVWGNQFDDEGRKESKIIMDFIDKNRSRFSFSQPITVDYKPVMNINGKTIEHADVPSEIKSMLWVHEKFWSDRIKPGYKSHKEAIKDPDKFLRDTIRIESEEIIASAYVKDLLSSRLAQQVLDFLEKNPNAITVGMKEVQWTGKELYHALVDKFGGKGGIINRREGAVKASEFLSSIGIKGHSYPVGYFGARKNPNKLNHVIYDPDTVEILAEAESPMSLREGRFRYEKKLEEDVNE